MQPSEGWIKLYRKSLYSAPFGHPVTWWVWSLVLLRAVRRECTTRIHMGPRTKRVRLGPGQCVIRPNLIARTMREDPDKTPIKADTIRRHLERLEEDGCITLHTQEGYTLVTVLNWESYQAPPMKLSL